MTKPLIFPIEEQEKHVTSNQHEKLLKYALDHTFGWELLTYTKIPIFNDHYKS